MTRKDYQLIADALKSARDESTTEWLRAGVERAASRVAQALRATNPRFDVTRFLVACGIPESEINQ